MFVPSISYAIFSFVFDIKLGVSRTIRSSVSVWIGCSKAKCERTEASQYALCSCHVQNYAGKIIGRQFHLTRIQSQDYAPALTVESFSFRFGRAPWIRRQSSERERRTHSKLFIHSFRTNHINGFNFDEDRWLLMRCKQTKKQTETRMRERCNIDIESNRFVIFQEFCKDSIQLCCKQCQNGCIWLCEAYSGPEEFPIAGNCRRM